MGLTWWLAFLWGVFGQFIRVFIGVKKQYTNAKKTGKRFEEWFDLILIVMTLIIGGLAGILGFMVLDLTGAEISKVTIIVIGYAGTDAIEGFFKEKIQMILKKIGGIKL